MLTFALIMIAATDPMQAAANAVDPWTTCLVKTSRNLAKSPDSAPTVAAAAITLCSSLEPPVRVALEKSSAAQLVRDGVVADAAEAKRLLQSVGNKGWTAYLRTTGDRVAAMVVHMRANPLSE